MSTPLQGVLRASADITGGATWQLKASTGMLLYDTLFRDDRSLIKEETRSVLKQATRFLTYNVAQYYFGGTDKENWDVATGDFPNIAPPYQLFWMEHRIPREIVSEELGRTEIPEEGRFYYGTLFEATDLTKEDSAHAESWIENGCRWFVLAQIFFGTHDLAWSAGPVWLARFGVDGQGRLWKNPFTGDWEWSYALPDGFVQKQIRQYSHLQWLLDPQIASKAIDAAIKPCLLAISFLHCKNVTVERQAPPAKLSRRAQKEHGRSLATYHVLNIEPMRRVMRREAGEHTGLKRSLHICRGHFKDFSEGRGLFGKYHGLYWWADQVRGSATAGTTDKSYNILPPRGDQ